MKPVVPPTELPDNIRPVMFQPPEGTEEEVKPLPGLVHVNPNGEPMACEFMFELSKKEIQTLRHEPYLTITMMVQAPPVFALQTTYDYDEKYKTLSEHSHICTANLTHDKNQFWQCDNPTHDSKGHRIRTCVPCFHQQEQGVLDAQVEDSPNVEELPTETED